MAISSDEANDRPSDLRAETLLTLLFRITCLHLPHELFDGLVGSNPWALGRAERTRVQLGKVRAALTRGPCNTGTRSRYEHHIFDV